MAMFNSFVELPESRSFYIHCISVAYLFTCPLVYLNHWQYLCRLKSKNIQCLIVTIVMLEYKWIWWASGESYLYLVIQSSKGLWLRTCEAHPKCDIEVWWYNQLGSSWIINPFVGMEHGSYYYTKGLLQMFNIQEI